MRLRMKNKYFSLFFTMTILFFNAFSAIAGEQKNNPFRVGGFQLKSQRATQEDFFVHDFFEYQGERGVIAAVFDGNGSEGGGDKISGFLQREFVPMLKCHIQEKENIQDALAQTFAECHSYFEREDRRVEYRYIGSTAIVTVVVGDTCFMAHLGDSRGYVKKKEGFFVTKDHNYKSNQIDRKFATDQGGIVIGDRLQGELAIS